MKFLVDIGGTHVRFALEQNGQPAQVTKYKAAQFPTFEEAVSFYAEETGYACSALAIATAAHKGAGGVWRFVNKNTWEIDEAALAKAGFPVRIILNDFEAAVWGLTVLKPAPEDILRAGDGAFKTSPRALIGPGTGLGLGFLTTLPDGNIHVQGTLGGHMPAAALSDEQKSVLSEVDKIKPRQSIAVYEDVVSGPGLVNIYRAIRSLAGKDTEYTRAADLLADAQSEEVQTAFRLFHEFFGLFAANVAVTGSAFGGVYLTGGMFDRLYDAGLFDLKSFEKYLAPGLVTSVQHALESTPIIRVQDGFLSLRGLLQANA